MIIMRLLLVYMVKLCHLRDKAKYCLGLLEGNVRLSGRFTVALMAPHSQVPAKSVCRETADEISMAAYNRALKLSMPGTE